MPAGPLFGLKGATHHAVERESIGAVDAFRRYTTAASTMWGGSPHGIEAGGLADLVVLSGNPLFTDTDRLRVEATIAQGKEVFRAPTTSPRRHSKHGR